MLVLHTPRVDFSIVCLCVMFSLGVAQANVIKRYFVTTNDRRILPSSTTIKKQRALSPTACASLCSVHQACCSASFDGKSKQCSLDESCCPESEPSEDALMLKNSTESATCPDGWFRNNNSCYFFSDDEKSWNDSRIACEEYGGMLAEVTSRSENDFLTTTGTGNLWIGGTDSHIEGVWVWESSQTEFIFTDWNNHGPDGGHNENCLLLVIGFQWHDVSCLSKEPFVCEKSVYN